MVYTYNQGVVLTGLRGLWLATGRKAYLEDGHELVERVIEATGWNDMESLTWRGLGRGGVLEEYCDSRGDCNQDGETFKGIFFHHLAEFCRVMWRVEEDFLSSAARARSNSEVRQGQGQRHAAGFDQQIWQYHLYRCEAYRDWVAHNAQAAAMTRDEEGRFGMWWGRAYPDDAENEALEDSMPPLPPGALDYYTNDDRHVLSARSGARDSGDDSRRVVSGECDVNDRGRGRTVETQSGGVAVLRALWQWEGGAGTGKKGRKVEREVGWEDS